MEHKFLKTLGNHNKLLLNMLVCTMESTYDPIHNKNRASVVKVYSTRPPWQFTELWPVESTNQIRDPDKTWYPGFFQDFSPPFWKICIFLVFTKENNEKTVPLLCKQCEGSNWGFILKISNLFQKNFSYLNIGKIIKHPHWLPIVKNFNSLILSCPHMKTFPMKMSPSWIYK